MITTQQTDHWARKHQIHIATVAPSMVSIRFTLTCNYYCFIVDVTHDCCEGSGTTQAYTQPPLRAFGATYLKYENV